MCGIIATVEQHDAIDSLLGALERLEYRGYDSAGVAVKNGGDLTVHKRSGDVDDLRSSFSNPPRGHIGIGHTRWSTHGPPTDHNAHPHTDTAGDIAVVHNGIVANHDELRTMLEAAGHTFESETDTEVIPHLIAEYRTECDTETAFRRAIDDLEGNLAVTALVNGEEAVYAARRGSPLVLGVAEDTHYLASDTPAFLEHTDRVIHLQDGDMTVLTDDGYRITDLDGNPVDRSIERIEWDAADAAKGEYEHFMLKEIHSQPFALARTIDGRIQDESIRLDSFPEETFADVETVHLVACGTSYHAAMYGEYMLETAGIAAKAIRASEYDVATTNVDESTLVIAVTQSGETADTLDAIRHARSRGSRTIAVTNVVGSTADRDAHEALHIRAGPEIGVAATKTFSSQAVALVLLSQRLAADVPDATTVPDLTSLLESAEHLPEQVEEILEYGTADRLAGRFLDDDGFFFIGRGLGHPVALEGALKFKEITYEHAEGFPAGELKHGPLALVTDETPVFAIYTDPADEKTMSNAAEAECRGAPIIAVGPGDHPGVEKADDALAIPETHPVWMGLLANVQLQLLAYHAARRLDRSIDKPRNLAKSVTVE